jgi:aminoglycoside phosphotransferase (APT) family kinase protein
VPEWRPEVVVDAGWARRLIGTQFPELERCSLRLLGEGWDNTVWLVDERWVFRFPRRAVAIPGCERELAVLPGLARRLPLPVPAPAFHGRPADGFPWPFTGAPLVPGRAVAVAGLTDADRVREARPLARFLRALHALEPADVVDDPSLLPADPNRRADMAMRTAWTVDRLAEIGRLGIWTAPSGVEAMLATACALPPPADPVTLAHGDLHILHLLAGADGRLSGVIDWGDVCRGDPGIDLGVYWSFVPPEGRYGFAAEYGPIDPAALLRARVLAVFLSATLAVYGRAQGDPDLERGAVEALDRAMAG